MAKVNSSGLLRPFRSRRLHRDGETVAHEQVAGGERCSWAL
ncbi:hypothetical protein QPR65_22710 (plasmid) [Enterobacter hormaechei]|nr:hypothetical protein [Enterobacter hormaechei]WLZ51948.1 hypothetical protein QPR65_22710 [Enterobacter hormaechei]